MTINSDLTQNIEALKKKIGQNDDIIFYTFSFGDTGRKACLIYIDGLTKNELLAEHIISPLQTEAKNKRMYLLTIYRPSFSALITSPSLH